MVSSSLNIIISETEKLLKQKGINNNTITENSVFLGSSLDIDSLDLATLIVQLEEIIGKDPFRDGFKEFKTVGELAKLYEKS